MNDRETAAVWRFGGQGDPQQDWNLPAQHTMHLMATAAVTVSEAAVENQRPEE